MTIEYREDESDGVSDVLRGCLEKEDQIPLGCETMGNEVTRVLSFIIDFVFYGYAVPMFVAHHTATATCLPPSSTRNHRQHYTFCATYFSLFFFHCYKRKQAAFDSLNLAAYLRTYNRATCKTQRHQRHHHIAPPPGNWPDGRDFNGEIDPHFLTASFSCFNTQWSHAEEESLCQTFSTFLNFCY